MTRSEYVAWKKAMEEKIDRKELTALEEGNVRMFCILQLKTPFDEEDTKLECSEDNISSDRS